MFGNSMSAELVIVLPWPAAVLSPNTRTHWSKRYRETKRYRRACSLLTASQVGRRLAMPERLHISMEFCAPSRRRYDLDNMVARMKSGIDGICDALQINDARFQSQAAVFAEYDSTTALNGGAVRIAIQGIK